MVGTIHRHPTWFFINGTWPGHDLYTTAITWSYPVNNITHYNVHKLKFRMSAIKMLTCFQLIMPQCGSKSNNNPFARSRFRVIVLLAEKSECGRLCKSNSKRFRIRYVSNCYFYTMSLANLIAERNDFHLKTRWRYFLYEGHPDINCGNDKDVVAQLFHMRAFSSAFGG